jgi:hypothetical protein
MIKLKKIIKKNSMLKNKIKKKKAIQGAQAWVVQFIKALRKKAQACMFCDMT